MIPPTPVVELERYDLARLGQPAGFVLTPARPRSPALRYRIPPRRPGEPQRWLRVVLRATLTAGGDHGDSGVGYVGLNTSGHVSAMAKFRPVGPRGSRRIAWAWSALNASDRGVSASRRVAIEMTNDARVQGARPGVHTLTFDIARLDGFAIERMTIDPGSGLELTRRS